MINQAVKILIESAEFKNYPGHVPQTVNLPYVNHFLVSTDPVPTKDGNQMRDIRYQVSVFAKMLIDVDRIAQEIISNLDNFHGNVAGHDIDLIRLMDESDLYEEDAEVCHRVLDFKIRYR